ncbi:MAG: radical SAM protein [Clostridia bacterium]|nr:radical SAM protein [Clostridia bacterium]
MKKKHVIIPVFIPHKGCPYDCIYCNQKSISGQMEEMNVDQMEKIVDEHLATITGEKGNTEIAFYGGSFTGIEKDEQIRFLKIAYQYIVKGLVNEIRLSTRPDYINEEVLTYLKAYGVKTIELGVQSLNEEVLKESCRGHSPEDVFRASEMIRQFGFTLGIQTMIGLPGDTMEKDLQTAYRVAGLNPAFVRIYPTLVIRGTYLERMYVEGKYAPLALDETIEILSKLLNVYEQKGIHVIRIGLQPTQSIRENGEVIAGPFHPALRQLVQSRIFLRKIEDLIEEKKIDLKEKILILSPKGKVSEVIGQKRQNIDYLKDKYGFKHIRVIEKDINDGEIDVQNQVQS